MKEIISLLLCVIMASSVLFACGEKFDDAETTKTPDETKTEIKAESEEFEVADTGIYKDVTPDENSEAINEIKEFILEKGVNIYSVSVVSEKHGNEVFIPRFCNACNDSYSVAKVYTLTAIGMLVDEGKLSTDDLIYTYFEEEMSSPRMDEKWKTVTVENVIAHKIGIGQGVLDIDTTRYRTEDFLSILFSEKIVHEPGTEFVYSDGAYYLLSRLVTKISGEKLDDFLMTRLMIPMRVQEAAWSKCPMGYPMGATGLYIRTADVANLGQVYLNGGKYNGKTYFSEDWAKFVLENQYELEEIAPGVYGKGGLYGQYLLISKNNNMVVAWHGAVQGQDYALLRDFVIELDKKITAGEIEA